MILDAAPITELGDAGGANAFSKAIGSFITFLEKKLRAHVVYDLSNMYMSRADLTQPLGLANLLLENKIIRSFHRDTPLQDEPPIRHWSAICDDKDGHRTGGISTDDDKRALMAALAEGLERYIWFNQTDFLDKPIKTTISRISKFGPFISPESFISYSLEQRRSRSNIFLHQDTEYVWTRATSLLSKKKVYIPAQTVMVAKHPLATKKEEPLIREKNTIGLATWPTINGARLRGMLEIIERESYMILWLNQLNLPRVELSSLTARSSSLATLIEKCRKYQLNVHVLRMLTDAPTHAIMVVLEDTSVHAPRFTFGLSAHESITEAAEHAVLEALRARRIYRNNIEQNLSVLSKSVDKIGHLDRVYYWGAIENAKRLEFIIKGEIKPYLFGMPWDADTPDQHLDRLLNWCKEKQFDCLSVSLGKSKKNPTPWYIEMVVMPDLHPVHLIEWNRHLGGTKRLTEVPLHFGYTPRKSAFIDEPHPYI